MWSPEKWAEIPLRSWQIREALEQAGLPPVGIINRKPVFDKTVDWQQVECIVATILGGGAPDDIKSNAVSSIERDVQISAPPPLKKRKRRGRPQKD